MHGIQDVINKSPLVGRQTRTCHSRDASASSKPPSAYNAHVPWPTRNDMAYTVSHIRDRNVHAPPGLLLLRLQKHGDDHCDYYCHGCDNYYAYHYYFHYYRIADFNNKKLQRRKHFTLLRNANLADPLLAVLPFLHDHEFLQRKYDNALTC